jgi:hypothetical protein
VLLIFYSVERSINLTNTANFIVSLVWYFWIKLLAKRM